MNIFAWTRAECPRVAFEADNPLLGASGTMCANVGEQFVGLIICGILGFLILFCGACWRDAIRWRWKLRHRNRRNRYR